MFAYVACRKDLIFDICVRERATFNYFLRLTKNFILEFNSENFNVPQNY